MSTLVRRRSTAEVIEKYHFNFQKKFGQNFLVDSNILDKIIESAQITREDCVLEIGPGIGTMTQRLAEEAGVPRELFGQRKAANNFNILNYMDFFTKAVETVMERYR